jgi:hypothetical protein
MLISWICNVWWYMHDRKEENPTPKSQPIAKSWHSQIPTLRASLDPSQSLGSSQSFNLIHPSSHHGVEIRDHLSFQPIWHNNHWQTNWPFLRSLWQMVLVILTSIACYMQTRIFQTKCYKKLPSSTFEIVLCVVSLCELKLTIWIGEQFLTFDIITKISLVVWIWSMRLLCVCVCVCVFFPSLYDH